jgi:transposase
VTQPPLALDVPDAAQPADAARTRPEQARVLRPVRNQVEFMLRDLDSLIGEEHLVCAIWDLLQRMDLSAFYARIKATWDRPGHPVTDPTVLLAVWVYATAQGISSARRLEELCEKHDAYRWLCGGVPMNYHTLSDFRTAFPAELDTVLTEILAILLAANVVTLKKVAQDGMRVRASAGAGSFHREEHLRECLKEAGDHVARLAREREEGNAAGSVREQQARRRAAAERSERIAEALRQLPEVQAAKTRQERTLDKERRAKIQEARVSTTDPDVRVMKMPDGGFRPAFNVEVATDVASGIIVGIDVINQGSDAGQAVPLEKQVVDRTDAEPEAYLVDGGFAQREAITTLTERGVSVYAPVRPPRTTTSGREKSTPRTDDTPAVRAWRERMETDEAKRIYRLRAATAEWANAQLRQHGLLRFSVRGLAHVRTVALLLVITHNLLRWIALAAA